MANYNETCRTNYFRVTDEKKYQELFHNLCSEDEIYDLTETRDNVIWHAFGSYSQVDFKYKDKDGEEDWNIDIFYENLQKILPEGEAFILMGAGHEKLRYVIGRAVVITKNNIRYANIQNAALKIARRLTGNPDWQTQMEY